MPITPRATVGLPTRDRARAAGGAVVAEGAAHDGGYAATFEDLDGHLWMVSVPPDA